MHSGTLRFRSPLVFSALACALACGDDPRPPPVVAPPPPKPAVITPPSEIADAPALTPPTKTKTAQRKTHKAQVIAWTRQGEDEYFCLRVPNDQSYHTGPKQIVGHAEDAHIDAVAFEGTNELPLENPVRAERSGPTVRSRSPAPAPVTCTVMVHAIAKKPVETLTLAQHWEWRHEDEVEDSTIEVGTERPKNPAAAKAWIRAVGESFRGGSVSAFGRFAATRAKEILDGRASAATALSRGSTREGLRRVPLVRAMGWYAGVDEVQEALEDTRPLFITPVTTKKTQTIDVTTLAGPPLETFPWSKMTAALTVTAPRTEPLAASTPAAFYFLRVSALTKLIALLEEHESFWGPAIDIQAEAWSRDASARYPVELGLRRTALAKVLGDLVVGEVALVGSDPYLREGTDVSLLFRVKNKDGFEAATKQSLESFAAEHGAITAQARPDGSTLHTSADGLVNSVRACAADVCIISNSTAAMSRILLASSGRAPRLSEEPDFAYMLAREAATTKPEERLGDLFGYLGERFVREVAGPQQKIAEARRQVALYELRTPGFAELLHGLLVGRAPASTEELVAKKLLYKTDLTHGSGETIDYAVGRMAKSPWGTVQALKPLLQLPPVTKVSDEEANAYKRFAEYYTQSYERYIDPIAVTARIELDGAVPSITYDMRILPPSKSRMRRDETMMLHELGLGRIKTIHKNESGVHFAAGIGKGSLLRRHLSELTRSGIIPGHKLTIDWLGDWVQAGVFENNAMLNLTFSMKSGEDELRRALALPAYLAVELKDKTAFALVLAKVRGDLLQSLPGALDWGAAFKHRGVEVMRIGDHGELSDSEDREPAPPRAKDRSPLAAFYAVKGNRLLITTREDVMKVLLERGDSFFVSAASDEVLGEGSTNSALSMNWVAGGPLEKSIAFVVDQAGARYFDARVEGDASALFRGVAGASTDTAIFDASARRIFGASPTTTTGARFRYGQAPAENPNPITMLAQHLLGASLDLAFDKEYVDPTAKEPVRSMHLRGMFRMRTPTTAAKH